MPGACIYYKLLSEPSAQVSLQQNTRYKIRHKGLDTPKNRRVVFARFSLKFYRLPTTRASYTVKLQRKACKNDAAVLGVSRP